MTSNYKSYCGTCDRNVIICGTCGNNTCNAGYGEVMGPEPDTNMPCPDCPAAYEEDRRMTKDERNADLK